MSKDEALIRCYMNTWSRCGEDPVERLIGLAARLRADLNDAKRNLATSRRKATILQKRVPV